MICFWENTIKHFTFFYSKWFNKICNWSAQCKVLFISYLPLVLNSLHSLGQCSRWLRLQWVYISQCSVLLPKINKRFFFQVRDRLCLWLCWCISQISKNYQFCHDSNLKIDFYSVFKPKLIEKKYCIMLFVLFYQLYLIKAVLNAISSYFLWRLLCYYCITLNVGKMWYVLLVHYTNK